jgi:hypothetical protein
LYAFIREMNFILPNNKRMPRVVILDDIHELFFLSLTIVLNSRLVSIQFGMSINVNGSKNDSLFLANSITNVSIILYLSLCFHTA